MLLKMQPRSSLIHRNESLNVPPLLQYKDFEDSILSRSLNSSYVEKLDAINLTTRYASPVKSSSRLYPPKSVVNGILDAPDARTYVESHESKYDGKYDNNNNIDKKTCVTAKLLTKDNDAFALHDNLLLQKHKVSSNPCRYSPPKNHRSPENKVQINSSRLNYQLHNSSVKNILGKTKEEMIDIKLFYQKKIGDLESLIEKRDKIISALNAKIEKLQQSNPVEEDYNKKSLTRSRLNRSYDDDLNKSFVDVERLVADNERDIMKAKEILITETKVLKENTEKLSESLKLTDEMDDAASKEREICLAKQEEYCQWIDKLRAEVLEKDVKITRLQKESIKLVSENQRLQKNMNDMAVDASETSMAITDLKAKIDEYKSAIEAIDSDKRSELMESEKRNKEKLAELESSMNRKFQSFQDEFFDKETKYKSFLEKHSLEIMGKEKEIQCLNDQLAKESHYANERISHMEEIISTLQGKYNLDITEYSERLGRQKLEYEEKLKGVLPLHAKLELEDTIESMRQQIKVVQAEKDLLEEELDTVTRFNLTCRSNEYKSMETLEITAQ